MKVSELIKKLQEFPPDSEVFEERESELRILHPDDISFDFGSVMTADGEDYDGPMIRLMAWS